MTDSRNEEMVDSSPPISGGEREGGVTNGAEKVSSLDAHLKSEYRSDPDE
jgi:hypothetical protein